MLELVVLRCGDIDAAAAFYSALGLPVVEERHGGGPRHFAVAAGAVVVELYPASDAHPVESSTQLGFAVDSVDSALGRLVVIGHTARRVDDAGAVVTDADGRTVRLSSARP